MAYLGERYEIDPYSEIENVFVGTTFDDFNIYDSKGQDISRSNILLQTKFSRNIKLNLPVVGANMDSLMNVDLAIALARAGGIGILPRSDAISIDEQAKRVRSVKRSENLIIKAPCTIRYYEKLGVARKFMEEREIGTLLVLNDNGQLVGVLDAKRQMRITAMEEENLEIANFMTPVEKWEYTQAETITSLEDAVSILKQYDKPTLPWVDANMKIRGLIKMKNIAQMLHNPWANKDSAGQLRVGAAIGATGDYLERAGELIKAGVDVIVMDIAHGFSMTMEKAVAEFRKNFGAFELVCGNVDNFEGAQMLARLGVDGVKVGVGPGYGCDTRTKTAVGAPQVHAIRAAWRGIDDNRNVPLIADGGVRKSRHVSVALTVGASSVMMGSYLAGTDESAGEIIFENGEAYKIYAGQTSIINKAKAVSNLSTIKNVEGRSQKVHYQGSVVEVLKDLRESLQSFVSYMGGTSLSEILDALHENAFRHVIPLSEAAKRESKLI